MMRRRQFMLTSWINLLLLLVVASDALGAQPKEEEEDHSNPNNNLRRNLQLDLEPEQQNWGMKKNKGDKRCEQVRFKTKYDGFDLDKYIQRSWYIQKQQVTSYQPPEDLFCVTATYNRRADGKIQVQNTGKRNSVRGEEITSDNGSASSVFGNLCAEQVIPNTGRLRVAPCILGPLSAVLAGPYWVVGLKDDPIEQLHDYKWAIVSGGAPDIFVERRNGRNFCKTSNTTNNCFIDTLLDPREGLWFLTRERVAPQETIDEMLKEVTALGYDTSGLIDVPHEGCTYPSNIKL